MKRIKLTWVRYFLSQRNPYARGEVQGAGQMAYTDTSLQAGQNFLEAVIENYIAHVVYLRAR